MSPAVETVYSAADAAEMTFTTRAGLELRSERCLARTRFRTGLRYSGIVRQLNPNVVRDHVGFLHCYITAPPMPAHTCAECTRLCSAFARRGLQCWPCEAIFVSISSSSKGWPGQFLSRAMVCGTNPRVRFRTSGTPDALSDARLGRTSATSRRFTPGRIVACIRRWSACPQASGHRTLKGIEQ